VGKSRKKTLSSNRPSFHEYFMLMAFAAATRSEDNYIKHGAIFVQKGSNHIIATGYNGTLKGLSQEQINAWNRDKRRPWMIHAEENAIQNCTKHPSSLPFGAVMYVTGKPCPSCLLRVVNFGIKEMYVAQRMGSMTDTHETHVMVNTIIKSREINYQLMHLENEWVKKGLALLGE